MFQRKANMKPATLQDGCNVSLRSLIDFVGQCETALKAKGQDDEAFRFECLQEYLRNDFHPRDGLKFKGGAIGL